MATRLFSGCFVILAALFVFVLVPGIETKTFGTSQVSAVGLGPTAVPYFAGFAVLILAAMMLAETFGNRAAGAPKSGAKQAKRSAAPLLIFAVLLLGFMGLLMTNLGFLLSATAFLLLSFLAFNRRQWGLSLGIAIAVPLLVDYLLRSVFLIPLPGFSIF